MFSLCQSSTCGYNYLRVGGRDGRLYLLDTTGDKFEEITVSLGLDKKTMKFCRYCATPVVTRQRNIWYNNYWRLK